MALSRDAKLIQCLQSTPLFAGAPEPVLLRLVQSAVVRQVEKRTYLFHRGDHADRLVLVLDSTLEVVRENEDGVKLVLRILGTGALVGISTIVGEPHSADVVVKTAGQVLEISGVVIRDLFAQYPDLPLKMIAHLSGLVSQLSDDVDELKIHSIEKRVHSRIIRLCQTSSEIELTHEDLANLVGASRANTSRALSRLAKRGVIQTQRNRIRLV